MGCAWGYKFFIDLVWFYCKTINTALFDRLREVILLIGIQDRCPLPLKRGVRLEWL